MLAFNPPTTMQLPVIRYVGDAETGIVHQQQSSCVVTVSEIFFDVRTALVRGYRLCSCCKHE